MSPNVSLEGTVREEAGVVSGRKQTNMSLIWSQV